MNKTLRNGKQEFIPTLHISDVNVIARPIYKNGNDNGNIVISAWDVNCDKPVLIGQAFLPASDLLVKFPYPLQWGHQSAWSQAITAGKRVMSAGRRNDVFAENAMYLKAEGGDVEIEFEAILQSTLQNYKANSLD